MKEWRETWCAGGELWWTHPDDPECPVMANCHTDIKQLAREQERRRGIAKAEFPPAIFEIVRVK